MLFIVICIRLFISGYFCLSGLSCFLVLCTFWFTLFAKKASGLAAFGRSAFFRFVSFSFCTPDNFTCTRFRFTHRDLTCRIMVCRCLYYLFFSGFSGLSCFLVLCTFWFTLFAKKSQAASRFFRLAFFSFLLLFVSFRFVPDFINLTYPEFFTHMILTCRIMFQCYLYYLFVFWLFSSSGIFVLCTFWFNHLRKQKPDGSRPLAARFFLLVCFSFRFFCARFYKLNLPRIFYS